MSSEMKILHIEAGRHLYGGALQVCFLLEGLQKAGLKNTLVCPHGSDIASSAKEYAQIHTLPMKGELDIRQLWQLYALIKKENPDLVHIHSRRGADIWGGLAAKIAGVPAIVTRRVDNPEPRWLVKWKYGHYKRVISISEGIKKVLLQQGLPSSKVTCVRSAVDVARYDRPAETEWFRQEFNLPEECLTIGVIAQLIPRKGHRYLLSVLPEILKVHPHTQVLFFGQGPIKDELRETSQSLGVDHHVQLCGFREDLPRILPNLDLVVHPALMEGLGVSLLQASSAGVPIVASSVGGIPEIVRDGQNGRLLDPGDKQGLQQTIIELLGSAQMRQQLGECGRNIAKEEFGIAAMVKGNLEIYVGLTC